VNAPHNPRTCPQCAELRHPSQFRTRKTIQAQIIRPRNGGAS
jgi:hypothetical protein